jgi:hypothetical protein
MYMMSADTFNQVLDLVESMSDEEQMILIDLIRKRRAERKRDEIAANITIAMQEYAQGQVFRGSVDDVMTELINLEPLTH